MSMGTTERTAPMFSPIIDLIPMAIPTTTTPRKGITIPTRDKQGMQIHILLQDPTTPTNRSIRLCQGFLQS